MGPERRCYTFRGRVQGVGFRASAHRLAQGFVLGGYVRNREDGAVELVAEGEPQVIDDFIGRLRGELGARITHVSFEAEPLDPTPAIREFHIRH